MRRMRVLYEGKGNSSLGTAVTSDSCPPLAEKPAVKLPSGVLNYQGNIHRPASQLVAEGGKTGDTDPRANRVFRWFLSPCLDEPCGSPSDGNTCSIALGNMGHSCSCRANYYAKASVSDFAGLVPTADATFAADPVTDYPRCHTHACAAGTQAVWDGSAAACAHVPCSSNPCGTPEAGTCATGASGQHVCTCGDGHALQTVQNVATCVPVCHGRPCGAAPNACAAGRNSTVRCRILP